MKEGRIRNEMRLYNSTQLLTRMTPDASHEMDAKSGLIQSIPRKTHAESVIPKR